MDIVLFENDIELLAKQERFFRFYNVSTYALYSLDELELYCSKRPNPIFIFNAHETQIQKYTQKFASMCFKSEPKTKQVSIFTSMQNIITKPQRLFFLRILKILELFFIDAGYEILSQTCTSENNYDSIKKTSHVINTVFFEQLPKTCYKILVNLLENPDGITKEELEKKTFTNNFKSESLFYVHVHHLRKFLNKMPDNPYKIQYNNKKYKLIQSSYL